MTTIDHTEESPKQRALQQFRETLAGAKHVIGALLYEHSDHDKWEVSSAVRYCASSLKSVEEHFEKALDAIEKADTEERVKEQEKRRAAEVAALPEPQKSLPPSTESEMPF